jgi:hypothetical protein
MPITMKDYHFILNATRPAFRFEVWPFPGNSRSKHLNRQESRVPPHFLKIAFPMKFPPERPHFFLLVKLDQGPEAKIHGFTLGLQTCNPKHITHKIIINHDIGSHDVQSSDKAFAC